MTAVIGAREGVNLWPASALPFLFRGWHGLESQAFCLITISSS